MDHAHLIKFHTWQTWQNRFGKHSWSQWSTSFTKCRLNASKRFIVHCRQHCESLWDCDEL